MATHTRLETETIPVVSVTAASGVSEQSCSVYNFTARSKPSFNTVPKEIKELFVGRILRPSDLKNVCLVNKELYDIAVRFLYRTVALDLGSSDDNRLSSMLQPTNKGLRHIRQLRLYLAPGYNNCSQEQQAQFATRMILDFLPEDVLEEFSWCPWRPFSAENIKLLYRKQRKMKWLEVMDLDRDILPDLQRNVALQATIFQNASKLAVYPENRDTLNLGGFFVGKTRDKLEELIINCNFDNQDGAAIDSRTLNDSATRPGLVTSTIFGCMTPFAQCAPFPKLKSLRLHRINLRYCADTWCKFIDFHELRYLRVYHCSGADTLFGQLSKADHLPKQLKVLEFQHRDNAEKEALLALDGFLCLVSGLCELIVDLDHVKSLPAPAGIARHGKTLEILSVHAHSTFSDGNCEEIVWCLDHFRTICKATPKLEQLSCAWPYTSLISETTGSWKSFEEACRDLPRLVTLHITTWPDNKPASRPLPRAVYESMLQMLAQRVFELATSTPLPSSAEPVPSETESGDAEGSTGRTSPYRSSLRLIAFGTSDKIYEREDSDNQMIFLRSSCIDAGGKSQVYAAPIGWCLRQFIEPRSEVLEYVLHRNDRYSKPPCRENREMNGWGNDDEDSGEDV